MTARAVAHPAAPAGGAAAPITGPRLRGLAWVAWRQQRLSLGFLALVAAGLTAYLVWSGLSTRSALAAMARAHCSRRLISGACLALYERADTYGPQWLIALPVVAALFVAAPLIARGYENGALRFALTQGVRRARWAMPQLTVAAVTGVILCMVPALAGAWWLTQQKPPYVPAPWHWDRTLFNVTPLMLPCWLLAGISVGALAAVVFRRAVAAMAATLTCAVAIAIAVSSLRLLQGALPGTGQPDSRFWLFQGIQAGILVAVAVALGALAIWLLHRRAI